MKKQPKNVKFDPTLILLTPTETARRLSITLHVLERRIKAGDFPAPRRIGRTLRFLTQDVQAYASSLPEHQLDDRGFYDEKQAAFKARHPIVELDEEEERIRQEQFAAKLAAWQEAERLEQVEIEANQPRRLPRGPKGELPLP